MESWVESEVLGPKYWSGKFEHDIESVFLEQDRLIVLVNTKNEAGEDAALKVSFEWIVAFRFMDEANMTYYANLPLITSTFHVYKILSGGWSNGEVRQQGILDASAGVYSEYLVATNNGCIQILSGDTPKIDWN